MNRKRKFSETSIIPAIRAYKLSQEHKTNIKSERSEKERYTIMKQIKKTIENGHDYYYTEDGKRLLDSTVDWLKELGYFVECRHPPLHRMYYTISWSHIARLFTPVVE